MKVSIQRKLARSSFAFPPGLSISVPPEAQRQLPDSLTGDEAHGEKLRFDLGDTEQIRNEKLIPPPHPSLKMRGRLHISKSCRDYSSCMVGARDIFTLSPER